MGLLWYFWYMYAYAEQKKSESVKSKKVKGSLSMASYADMSLPYFYLLAPQCLLREALINCQISSFIFHILSHRDRSSKCFFKLSLYCLLTPGPFVTSFSSNSLLYMCNPYVAFGFLCIYSRFGLYFICLFRLWAAFHVLNVAIF